MTQLYELPAFRNVIAALRSLSTQFGINAATESISHGLSVRNGKISPIDLAEAASRTGLLLSKVDPNKATRTHCPLLLCQSDGRAAVVTSLKPGGLGEALTPEGTSKNVLIASLVAAGFQDCWSVSRSDQRDERTVGRETNEFSWFHRALFMGLSNFWPVVLATVIINFLALAVPLISMNVFDRVLSHAAYETLWALALGGVIAITAEFILRNLRGELIDRASARSDVYLSNGILRKVLGAKPVGKSQSIGAQASSLREYESLREIYNSTAIAALGDVPFAILFLIVLWVVAGPLAIVSLVAMPLLLIAGVGTQWKLGQLAKEHFKDMAHKSAIAIEALAGLSTLKSHAGESWAAYKWEAAVAAHLKHSTAMRRWSSLSTHLIIALQSLTTIALLVVGVYLVTDRNISPGALFAASMLTSRCLAPVAQVAGLLGKIHTARSAYKAIRQLTSLEQERPPSVQLLSGPERPQSVRFENVHFSYSADTAAVLNDISVVIEPGEKIGVMGGIGSGKSSFLQILLGVRTPTQGAVTMGGVPIAQIDPGRYRGMFGVSFQAEELFYGSIYENIAFHRLDASEEDVVEAARISGALDWIKTFSRGFAATVSEGGRNLSSGQRQTLGLARAFLSRPPIVLLDEPTSNLDIRSETEIVRHLKCLSPETTLVAVSHRLPILDACERLIFFDRGRIILDGEKTLVLARLKQMNRMQKPIGEARS